ncbi:MAG: hypothetical protein IJQ07_05200 [Clostridia bacterium]|nr:hypothetical protein [Clostridia bacterium]
MKAILISIQPQHIKNICTIIGYENKKPIYKKTAEIRKTCPKIKPPFKCFIYCTRGQYFFFKEQINLGDFTGYENVPNTLTMWNQKVIGEFTCDRIYKTIMFDEKAKMYLWGNDFVNKETCLSSKEMNDYGKGKPLYGLHISNLKIYDKPKEISEFKKAGFMTEEEWLFNLYPNTHCHYEAWVKKFNIDRPPQSWCYVEI